MRYYDGLETQTSEQRAAYIAEALPAQIAHAKQLPGYADRFERVTASEITDVQALATLPVLRKSELSNAQKPGNILGGFVQKPLYEFSHIFQSPGPLYEPGGTGHDWWRMGRFLHAAGIGRGDIVQNCFGYHLTPA